MTLGLSVYKPVLFILKEIHRRIELVPKIVYEPRVSDESNSKYILPPGSSVPPFYYRLKACDDVKLLGMLLF